MKNIYHIQQIGHKKYEQGDMIVQGRDEFHDDIDLAEIVAAPVYGTSSRARTLHFVTLQDLTEPEEMPPLDFDRIMESLEERELTKADMAGRMKSFMSQNYPPRPRSVKEDNEAWTTCGGM